MVQENLFIEEITEAPTGRYRCGVKTEENVTKNGDSQH